MNKHLLIIRLAGMIVLVFLLGAGFSAVPGRAGQLWNSSIGGLLVADPVANPDYVTTSEDTAKNIKVTDNDDGLDSKNVTLTVPIGPAHGLTEIAGLNIKYTPVRDYYGQDMFTYRVCNDLTACDDGDVFLTILAVNDTPVVLADTASTRENEPVIIHVLDNDGGLGDQPITVTVTTVPGNGTAVVNLTNTVTYSPNAGFSGTDYFYYQVCDVDECSLAAQVSVTVLHPNEIPVAVDDLASTAEDTPSAPIPVLANDGGLGDTPLEVSIAVQGAHGTAVVNGDNTVTYTPAANFNGEDTFWYRVCDVDTDCSLDTPVTMSIAPVDDLPAAAGDSASTAEDTPSAPIDVLANDTGLGDTPLTVSIAVQGAYGTAAVSNNAIVYTPEANFIGEDTFWYKVCDADSDCSLDTPVTVNVTPTDDIPGAAADSASAEEDASSAPIDVLANDSGLGDPPFTVSITAQGAHGTAVVNGDNTVTYTPAANFNGEDTFWYRVCDADSDCSLEAPVTINVAPVDDIPGAAADLASTAEDTPSAPIDVLDNDTELWDTPLTVSIAVQGAHGTAAVNGDKTITYTPSANFNGVDAFIYEVCDSNGDCPQATVNVTINPVNDEPIAAIDAIETYSNSPVRVDVLQNDGDIDGDPLFLLTFDETSAQGGTITLFDNGTPADPTDDQLTYLSATDYEGLDSFNYTVSDNSLTDGGKVNVTVRPPRPRPLANDDSYQADQDVILTVDAANGVLSNDVDLEGHLLTAVKISDPAHGTLNLNSDGSFTYTPAAGYSGADQFTYQASDGDLFSLNATATIEVKALAPLTAVDDSFQIGQDTSLVVAAPGVLGNDNSGEVTGLTVSVVAGPSHGTLSLSPTGSFTYVPTAGYVGADQFTYAISDGTRSAQSQVALTVIDTQVPVVSWTSPVQNGQRYDVGGEIVQLEAQANDNVGIERVRFYRWDPTVPPKVPGETSGAYVEISMISAGPYVYYFDTSELVPNWNNIFCKAYDKAGNESVRQWIWLYNTQLTVKSYLPVIQH